MRLLSKAISVIFHPILMPFMGIFVVFQSSFYLSLMPKEGKSATYLIVFISTFLLPIIMQSLFLLRKVIKTLEMTEAQERVIPFMVTSIFYFFSYYSLHELNAPSFISSYILGASIIVLFTALISVWWKISAHMAGIGGVVGMILVLSDVYSVSNPFFFVESILIAGFIGSARLYLKSHDLKQIALGFVMGVTIMMSVLYILV